MGAAPSLHADLEVDEHVAAPEEWARYEESLIANGDNDRMVPSLLSTDLHRRIKGSELIIYPDSGHGGIFQYHDQFVPAALEFFDMTASAGKRMSGYSPGMRKRVPDCVPAGILRATFLSSSVRTRTREPSTACAMLIGIVEMTSRPSRRS